MSKANGNNNGGNGQGNGNAASKSKGNKDNQAKKVGRIRKQPVSHTVQSYFLIFFLDILAYLVKFVIVRGSRG